MERVETPLSTSARPCHFTRIVRLLLDDGTDLFGCTECDFTSPAVGSVRHHLRDHSATVEALRPQRKPRSVPSQQRAVPDISLSDLLQSAERAEAMGDALERLAADRNEWKARALKAERAMATLKRVLL